MIIQNRNLVVYTFLFVLFGVVNCWSAEVIGKVIDSYVKGDTTHCTIEVKKPLIVGSNTSLSDGSIVTVGEKLGEKYGLYYYDVSAIDKHKISPGTDVFSEEVKDFIKGKDMFLKMERKKTFAPKKFGEVTAVQKDRALIDKGSLHEVRERDLYAIYDSSGRYKGKMELSGVGDFQSSGKHYHSLEDVNRGVKIEPGDKVEYLGQRKLFGLGLQIGSYLTKPNSDARAFGGGLLWNLTFPDGWGTEVLFGGYSTQLEESEGLRFVKHNSVTIAIVDENNQFLARAQTGDSYELTVIAPTIIKKNFFYPKVVTPYLGVGFGLFNAKYESRRAVFEGPIFLTSFGDPISKGAQFSDTGKKILPFPIFATGFSVLPTKFFQFNLDFKYFMTPDINTGFSRIRSRTWVYSIGFITAW